MPKIKRKLILFLVIFACLAIFASAVFFSQGSKTKAQDSVTLSLSSSCTECKISSDASANSVTVWTSIDTAGNRVGSIEINLNYNKDLLKYKSIQYDSSFDTSLTENIAENVGVITVIRGKIGGMTGSAKIFGVTFQMLQEGKASFSLGPVDGADENGRIAVSAGSLDLNLAKEEPAAVSVQNPTQSTPSTTKTTSKSGSKTSTTAQKSVSSATIAPDFSKSTVAFDKMTAIADDADKICPSITLMDKNSKVEVKTKPEIKFEGAVNQTDPVLKGNTWSFCVSSTLAEKKRLLISAAGIIIKDEILEFSQPVQTKAANKPASLESFLVRITGNVKVAKKNDAFHKSGFSDSDMLEITGKGIPGAILKLYIHSSDQIVKTVVVDKSGNWAVQIDKPLLPGEHRVDVALVDKNGKESRTKTLLRFTVIKSFLSKTTFNILAGIISVALAILALVILKKRKNKLIILQGINTGEIPENPNNITSAGIT